MWTRVKRNDVKIQREKKKRTKLSHPPQHTLFSTQLKKKKKKSLPHGNTPTHHHADALKANHTHTRPQTQGFLTLRSTPGRRHYCLTFEQTLTGNKHSLSLTASFKKRKELTPMTSCSGEEEEDQTVTPWYCSVP